LIASPLYVAVQCQVPEAFDLNPLDVAYVPFTVTVTVFVKAGVPLHVASAGPNNLKAIVPVGPEPPLTVAPSLSVSPTVAAVGFALVASVVTARFTTTASALQAFATSLLMLSPV